MIIPFFGYIGKRTLSGEGISSSGGFIAKIYPEQTTSEFPFPFVFVTGNYYDGEHVEEISTYHARIKRVLIFCAVLVLALLIVGARHENMLNGKILFFSITGVILFFLCGIIYAAIETFRKETDTREWHACEHKSIVLIEAGETPSIEALARCPKTLFRCGTSCIIFLFQFLPMIWGIGLMTFVFDAPFIYTDIFIHGVIAMLMFILIIQARSISLCYRGPLLILLLPLALPFFILPFIAEYFFTVKEPSKEKLHQTAEALTTFIQKHSLYEI